MCPIVLLDQMACKGQSNYNCTNYSHDILAQEIKNTVLSSDDDSNNLPDLIHTSLFKSHSNSPVRNEKNSPANDGEKEVEQSSPAKNDENEKEVGISPEINGEMEDVGSSPAKREEKGSMLERSLLETPVRRKVVISRSAGGTRILHVPEESNIQLMTWLNRSSMCRESESNTDLTPLNSDSSDKEIPVCPRNKVAKRKRQIVSASSSSDISNVDHGTPRKFTKNRFAKKERRHVRLEEDDEVTEGSSVEDGSDDDDTDYDVSDDDDDDIPDIRSPTVWRKNRSKKCVTCDKMLNSRVGVQHKNIIKNRF